MGGRPRRPPLYGYVECILCIESWSQTPCNHTGAQGSGGSGYADITGIPQQLSFSILSETLTIHGEIQDSRHEYRSGSGGDCGKGGT